MNKFNLFYICLIVLLLLQINLYQSQTTCQTYQTFENTDYNFSSCNCSLTIQCSDKENDCLSCNNVTRLNGTCVCPSPSTINFDPLEKNQCQSDFYAKTGNYMFQTSCPQANPPSWGYCGNFYYQVGVTACCLNGQQFSYYLIDVLVQEGQLNMETYAFTYMKQLMIGQFNDATYYLNPIVNSLNCSSVKM